MGWVISLAFIVAGVVCKEMNYFYVAGIFGIAGSIATVANSIEKR